MEKSAILRIVIALTRKPLQHKENDILSMVRDEPELVHKTDTIRVLRPDDAKPICRFDDDLRDFSG